MFAFTSTSGKLDQDISKINCPYIFKIGGQTYHAIDEGQKYQILLNYI